MRKLLFLALLVVAAGLMAVFASAAPSATRVDIGDNYFVRPSGVPKVTVSKGTRVRWVWTGESLHNVKVKSGPASFKSPKMTSGTWAKKLRKRGGYTIICTVHGGKDQKMQLVVE